MSADSRHQGTSTTFTVVILVRQTTAVRITPAAIITHTAYTLTKSFTWSGAHSHLNLAANQAISPGSMGHSHSMADHQFLTTSTSSWRVPRLVCHENSFNYVNHWSGLIFFHGSTCALKIIHMHVGNILQSLTIAINQLFCVLCMTAVAVWLMYTVIMAVLQWGEVMENDVDELMWNGLGRLSCH